MPLELKVPPPAVAVVVAAAMWIALRTVPPWPISTLNRITVAVPIAAIGVAVSAAGVIAFHRAKTTTNPMQPLDASSLVSSGVYRVTRNPMYLGLVFVLIAWALFLASTWAFFGPLIFAVYMDRFQIRPEEKALSVRFGAAYAAYKATVRRWL